MYSVVFWVILLPFFVYYVMMKSFYDSLDTLQKVQFATKKDYINLGIGVVVSVIIFGAFFIGVDTIWSGLYKTFYNGMRGSDQTLEQLINQPWVVGDETATWSLLDSIDLWDWEIQIETEDGTQAQVEILAE